MRYIQATIAASKKKVYFNGDLISAIVETGGIDSAKAVVYTSGDDEPFRVVEDPNALLGKLGIGSVS